MPTNLRSLIVHWRMRRDPVKFAASLGVQIGADCRLLGIQRNTFGSEPYLVRLGDHVTVSSGARFVTHDGGVWVFRKEHPDLDVFAPISVGNNVFIGANALILKGVSIGDNCVVGAGSVVTRSIPAGSVVGGCPARLIKTIDEYWLGIQQSAVCVRELPESKKRNALERLFYGSILRQS